MQAARSAWVMPFHQPQTMAGGPTQPLSSPEGSSSSGQQQDTANWAPLGTTSQVTLIAGLVRLEKISQPLLEVSGYEQYCPALFWGCQHCCPQGPWQQQEAFLPTAQVDFHIPFTFEVYFPPITQTLHSKPHKVWQKRAFPQNLLHLGWACLAVLGRL